MEDIINHVRDIGKTADDSAFSIATSRPIVTRFVRAIQSGELDLFKEETSTADELIERLSQAVKSFENEKESCSRSQDELKNAVHILKELTHADLRRQPGRQCQSDSGFGSLGSARLGSNTYSANSCQMPGETGIVCQESGRSQCGKDCARFQSPSSVSVDSLVSGVGQAGKNDLDHDSESDDDNTAIGHTREQDGAGMLALTPERSPTAIGHTREQDGAGMLALTPERSPTAIWHTGGQGGVLDLTPTEHDYGKETNA